MKNIYLYLICQYVCVWSFNSIHYNICIPANNSALYSCIVNTKCTLRQNTLYLSFFHRTTKIVSIPIFVYTCSYARCSFSDNSAPIEGGICFVCGHLVHPPPPIVFDAKEQPHKCRCETPSSEEPSHIERNRCATSSTPKALFDFSFSNSISFELN